MSNRCAIRGAVVAILSLGAVLMPGTASAAIIQVYSNDLVGWQAAAGGPVIVEDFSDGSLVSGFSITFGSSRPGSISGGEYLDRTDDSQATMPLFSFSPGVTAFGANWDLATPGGEGSGITLFLTFVDSTTQTVLVEIPNSFTGEFFGIVSDTAIASIRLDEGTQGTLAGAVETFDMDNARFVAAVPEPAALALFGLGLAGLGFARRRKAARRFSNGCAPG